MDEAQTVNLSSGTGPEDTNTEQSGEKQTRESEKISESGEKQMGESEKISESGEKQMGESEKISEAVLPPEPSAAPLDSVEGTVLPSPMELCPEESKLGANAAAEEPPVDWFEPLEDDDDPQALDRASFDHHYSRKDPEEESLAGESEKSFVSVKKRKPFSMNNQSYRGKKIPDEGWDDCPALGEGWKRREVIRRSGSSIGHKDVYYLSPHGERLRSRVELMTLMEGRMDLSSFEFKSGRFRDASEVPPKRVRRKREVQDHSSSESSWRGEGADTPDSLHRLNPGAKLTPYNQMSPYPLGHARVFKDEDDVKDDRIKLPNTFSSKPPSSSVNGLALINPEDTVLICYNCGIRFVGTYYDKQRKKPWCPSCWEASKAREHPLIRFRKWIPCGQCVACRNTTNCGQCANCKHGMESPDARKRLCRKRKCICPIRKGSGMETQTQQSPFDLPDTFNNMNYQNEIVAPPQRSSYQSYPNSDTEDFNPFDDFDDDDDSTDDDDNWHKKRKRRACGTCNACLCRKDCGTCDFCYDKPKFGGSNKKRQKCRLRQCQRQAMRHLLPGFSQHEERLMMMGRPKPQYTYSRKTNPKKNKGRIGGLVWTDNEDEDSNQPTMSWSYENTSNSKYSELNYIDHQSSVQVNHLDSRQRNGLPNSVSKISNNGIGQSDQLSRWEADRPNSDRVAENHSVGLEGPMVPQITQIYSMADGDTATGSGSNMDDQLLELLQALRNSALPLLWYVVLAEGPQLQLVQCSKQSSMSDTMVLIDPGFCYQVVVQKQPLLLTHPLYDDHPSHMNTPTEVATLLLDLEKYRVCQGLPLSDQLPPKGLIIFERASTCDFLVKKDVESCVNCQAL